MGNRVVCNGSVVFFNVEWFNIAKRCSHVLLIVYPNIVEYVMVGVLGCSATFVANLLNVAACCAS